MPQKRPIDTGVSFEGMNTPERRANSLELKRQLYLEQHPMTSNYAAMFTATGVDQPISGENSVQEDIGVLNHTDARDPAEPRLDAVMDGQQALIRNDMVSSDSESDEAQSLRPAIIHDCETHEVQSAEPAIIHFDPPEVPTFYNDTEVIEESRGTREDKQRFRSGCVRIRKSNDIDDAGGTRGELRVNTGGIYVESEEEKEARYAWAVRASVLPETAGEISIIIDGQAVENVNNNDTDINSQNSRRPYLVFGLLSTSTSIPKEEMIHIKLPHRLFEEFHKAASKLRPWPIRILSLKSVSGFAIYECTEQGVHRRVRVDQSTQDILAEMFRAYNSGRRDTDSRWIYFVHKELNKMQSNPRLGKHSLQLVLSWSALKLVVWGSTPILLSLFIGFWYMFSSHPGEDPVAIVQTAWGISSYIVTAGARTYYSRSGHASFILILRQWLLRSWLL